MTAKLWQEVKKVSISKEDNKLPTISRETQCQESANFQVHFGPCKKFYFSFQIRVYVFNIA